MDQSYQINDLSWQRQSQTRLQPIPQSQHLVPQFHPSFQTRSPDFGGQNINPNPNAIDYRFRAPSQQSDHGSTSSSRSPRSHFNPQNNVMGAQPGEMLYGPGMPMASGSRMSASVNSDGSWYGSNLDSGGQNMPVNYDSGFMPPTPTHMMGQPNAMNHGKGVMRQKKLTGGLEYQGSNGMGLVDMNKVLQTYQTLLSTLPSIAQQSPHSPLDPSQSSSTISPHSLKNLTEIASFGLSLLSAPPIQDSPHFQSSQRAPPSASNNAFRSPSLPGPSSLAHVNKDMNSGPVGGDDKGVGGGSTDAAPAPAAATSISCLGCGASDTPEWRRGPMGPRTLCNACGLVFAKLVRKRAKEAKLNAAAAESSPSSQPTNGDSAKKKKPPKKKSP